MTDFTRTLAVLAFALFGLSACFSPVPQEPARPLPDNPRSAPTAPVATTRPTAQVPSSPLDASVYRLDGGDAVRIDVLGEPDLSLEALIDPSGFINYPFLGKVQASGLTVRELETKVRNGLRSGFLVNPDVRVALARYRPVYIGGQVRQPGVYPYALGLNVERALTLAGGLTAFASSGRIYIQRHGTTEDGRVRADLQAPVFPGDYIIIEERLF